jgi:hypothetical protein
MNKKKALKTITMAITTKKKDISEIKQRTKQKGTILTQ